MAKITPKHLEWIHGGFAILWFVLWMVAIPLGWLQQVTFVSHMSMAALVYASVSAWQGSRTEVKQDENNGD